MDDRKIKVACLHAGGLQLRLLAPEPGEPQSSEPKLSSFVLAGPRSVNAGVGAPTGVEPMITEVPAAFWAEWLAENRGKSPIIDSGLIYEVEDEAPREREAENPTG